MITPNYANLWHGINYNPDRKSQGSKSYQWNERNKKPIIAFDVVEFKKVLLRQRLAQD